MALIHSMESSGNFLFRYRGQFPVILFIFSVPIIYYRTRLGYNFEYQSYIKYLAFGISVFGFIFRAFAIGTTPRGTSGRNTREQVAEQLNHKGIYSIVRHPLYVGNYFMWAGIVVFTYDLYFLIMFSLAYWLYYERIMFAEERFLEKKFGEKYLSWSLQVPAFIPAFNMYIKGETPFSIKPILRREYSGILAMVAGFVFVHLLRIFFLKGEWVLSDQVKWLLIITIVVTLILKSLKKYTRLLNEDNRS